MNPSVTTKQNEVKPKLIYYLNGTPVPEIRDVSYSDDQVYVTFDTYKVKEHFTVNPYAVTMVSVQFLDAMGKSTLRVDHEIENSRDSDVYFTYSATEETIIFTYMVDDTKISGLR